MIKLSSKVVMLIKPDGSQVEFDAEELQSGIINSCLVAGSRDVWIAEDIALSIEYALTLPGNRERTFTVSDINSIVIKILEETGYPEVAEEFRQHNSSIGLQVNPEFALVGELVKRHLGLSGNNLALVTDKVIEAAEKLNIEEAAPTLYVELAKLYKDQLLMEQDVNVLHMPDTAKPSPWQLVRNDIKTALKPESVKLLEAKVLNYSGISQLFPALKLDFRITKLVNMLGLESPLTEMVIITHFRQVASAMNDIVAVANKLREQQPTKIDMPIYLHINDMSRFACNHLLSQWPEAEPGCREMIAYLEEMLDFSFFKISLK